ncbi:hypothetical protein Mia14_0103 [Candidatus Mancarchaeum acidiphilum]|uniref:Uncharacterized protein n=1 Tax=Candidatus Mancarchaeum acidiphilum TaxID=1920749 RepID=A0A218NLV6_9ARCH|nr:hypothetical protein [Candidatus Mancarchaeum acidiphilum]ASI13446.1 hypothetical protein Mia14_0103 [Candidatus Mancarchaeum acidiphilum]
MPKKNSDKNSNKKKQMKVAYVKLASLKDFVKSSCDFSRNFLSSISMKEGKRYRLIAEGERINETEILYYYDTDKISNFIIYNPVKDLEPEMSSKKDNTDMYNNYIISIASMLSNPFKESELKQGSVNMVEIESYKALLIAAINRFSDDNSIGKIYLFNYGKKPYIGTFNLMNGSDNSTFFFSKLPEEMLKEDNGFFKYDYNSDSIEINNNFSTDNLIHVRIVNLAEPFKFFKPE